MIVVMALELEVSYCADAAGTVLVEDVNDVIAAYRQQNGQMKLEQAMPRVFQRWMLLKTC